MKKHLITSFFILFVPISLLVFTLRGSFGNYNSVDEIKTLTAVAEPFESSHERSPYAMFLAMKNNSTVELTKDLADFASPDVGFINGKFYSFFPAGVPLLIWPMHAFLSQNNLGLLGAYASMAVLSLGSLVLLFLICRQIVKLPMWASLLAPLIFGFASTAWSYSITIYQHAPTVFLLLLMFYSAWKYRAHSKVAFLWGIIAFTSYGFAILVDYPNALLFAPVAVYAVFNAFVVGKTEEGVKFSFRYSVLVGLLFFVAITLAHLHYNQQVFGSALQFHNPAPRYTPETFDILLENQAQGGHAPGDAIGIFNEFSFVKGLYELTVAPDKGLFFFSPIFLIAVLGIAFAFAKKITTELGVLLAVVLLNVFLYSSFGDPWGGWAFGPRYLIPTMAALSVFVAYGLTYFRFSLTGRIVAFVLIAYSSAVALVGVLTTNLIPPKVEADFLGLKYNYLRNIDFLKEGVTGNFLFNEYFKEQYSLSEYFLGLYIVLMVVFALVLLVLPALGRKKA